MRLGPPLGEPFEIIVSSNNNKERLSASSEVADFLKNIKGVSDVKDDQIQGKDEINLKLNYKKVAQAGLTPADIIRTLRIAFDGQVVTDYSSINNSYDFRLRLNKKFRGNFNFISNLPIANKRGQLIKLKTMIEYEQRPSYAEIKHFNGFRSTSIIGNIDPQKITAVEMLKYFDENFNKENNVNYTISGQPVEEEKIFSGLKIAAILALVGIYFILCLMFDSYSRPLMIMTVIPFGVVGIFLSFFAHGLPISMFAGIGLIGLSGIVVNNSIVLIDHISQLLKEHGKFSKEVLIRASKERLRPIYLTTISTILAVAPTGYALGGYDPLLSPLSLAILYGLLFGTTVVLIFMPNLYVIGDDLGRFLMKYKKKSKMFRGYFFLAPVLLGFGIKNVQAEEVLNIRRMVELIKNTNEYKIQNESVNQAEIRIEAANGMLDAKLTSKIFRYTSEIYPNPPITLDLQKRGYGASVDYEKMTSFGVKFGIGIGLEDRESETIPVNSQFGINAIDNVFMVKIGVPLWKNFGSKEYHINKEAAIIRKKSQVLESKSYKDKQIVEAVKSFWTIAKLQEEIKIAKKSLTRFQALHRLNMTKRKSGIISRAEFLTSEVEIMNREKTLKDLELKIKTENLNLQSILELEKHIQVDNQKMNTSQVIEKISDQAIDTMVDSGITYKKMEINNDLFDKLSFWESEKAKSNVDFFISLKSFGRGDTYSDAISENTLEKHEVYAGISWDFNPGGKRKKSDVSRALSLKRQADYLKNKTRLQLIKLIETFKGKISSNLHQVKLLEEIKNQQFEILKAENKRFENGRITTLDYVKLQEAYDRSSLQLISLKYLNEITALNLYFTVGMTEDYLKNY